VAETAIEVRVESEAAARDLQLRLGARAYTMVVFGMSLFMVGRLDAARVPATLHPSRNLAPVRELRRSGCGHVEVPYTDSWRRRGAHGVYAYN
jgi:hypothetical protein